MHMWYSGFQLVTPGPAASAVLWNLLKMQIFKSQPKFTEPETLRMDSSNLYFKALQAILYDNQSYVN